MERQPSSPATRICANPHCQRSDIRSRGRCQACYLFLYRNGRDARPEEMQNRSHLAKICKNCKERPIRARGRCYRCYKYWWRTGLEHPAGNQAGASGLCANCGRRRAYRQDRCRSCFAYLQVRKEERPGA